MIVLVGNLKLFEGQVKNKIFQNYLHKFISLLYFGSCLEETTYLFHSLFLSFYFLIFVGFHHDEDGHASLTLRLRMRTQERGQEPLQTYTPKSLRGILRIRMRTQERAPPNLLRPKSLLGE